MDKWDRKVVVAMTLIASFLAFGTLFYHAVERWSYVDSFYFSGVTLTTVGYGDIVPSTPLAKIVTVLFAFAGIGIVFYSISVIAQKYFEREEMRLQQIWESTSRKKKDLQDPDVRISGTKAALLQSSKRDQERTAAILKKSRT